MFDATVTRKDMEAVISGEIIELRGLSGIPATLEMVEATSGPVDGLIRAHAMSGLVLEVGFDRTAGTFRLTEVK